MRRIVGAIATAILLLILFTSTVLAYVYYASLSVTETSGNSYTQLPVRVSAGTQWMADNGFILASALDTRVTTSGGSALPWLVADDKILTVTDVPNNSQTNLLFTTGNTPASQMDIVVGDGGTVTITDSPNLEIAGAGTLVLSDIYAKADIGTSDNLQLKTDALRICDSDVVDNYVAGYIPSVYTSMASQLVITSITPNLSATDWEGQTFTATKSALVSRVRLWPSTAGGGAANIVVELHATAGGVPSSAVLARTPETAVIPAGGDVDCTFNCPYFVTNGATYAFVVYKSSGADSPQLRYNNTNPYAGGQRVTSADTGATWTPQAGDDLYFNVYYCDGSAVSGVTAGEHDLTVEVDGATFDLTVDATTVSEAFVGTIPNNVNPYIFNFNDALMPYIGTSISLITAVSGVSEKVLYQPNDMIAGTVLPNRAAGFVGSYNGIISWGSNPAGVTLTLGSMVAEDQPTPGTLDDRPTRDLLPEAGGSDWNEDPAVAGALLTHPFRSFIVVVSDATTFTESQIWLWSGIAFVLFVLGLALRFLSSHKLIVGIAFAVAVLAMVVQSIFPIWALVISVLSIIVGVVAERSPSL